jgi:hypothetical protein
MGPNALKYILNVARKSLVKDKGSGIMQVPGRMDAEAKASEFVTRLTDAGLGLDKMDDFIRSEADVKKYLNILDSIERERMKVIPADSPQGREITEQLFGKRGEVVDMTGKKIPPGSRIMGGKQIKNEPGSLMSVNKEGLAGIEYEIPSGKKTVDDLIQSGDIKKGEVTKKSGKVLERDMFKAANERFKKTDINKIIKNINRLDPIESMKEANKIIKREDYYKNLSDKDAKRILEETEDHIFGRDVDPEPEDFFATGGRVGLKDGPPDPSKRKFMKIAAGLASIPIVGKFFKPAKVAKTVSKVPLVKTPPVNGKPEWFDALVNKVILEGDDVTKQFATKDREIVHTKKLNDQESVTVTQDLDDGVIRVEYDSPDNMGQEPVMMQFKPGMADETTGAKKPRDRFDVAETEPQYVGGPEDADIEFIGESGGPGIDYIASDVTNLKTFATGKGPTMKEIVKSKKRKELVGKVNNDSYEAAEYLGGKYGDAPEPDFPDDYDGFASGGIARMLGE